MQQRASYKYEYIPRIQNYAVFFENGFKEKNGGAFLPQVLVANRPTHFI